MIPPLQIFQEGPDVEIRITVDDETHSASITPREAYTLATFIEWLTGPEGRDMPSTFANLPDHVAADLSDEVCPDCPTEHLRPVLFFAIATGEGLAEVEVIELRHPDDFRNLPYFLNFAALAAHTFEEHPNV